MNGTLTEIKPEMTMGEILTHYPSAKRALHSSAQHHILLDPTLGLPYSVEDSGEGNATYNTYSSGVFSC